MRSSIHSHDLAVSVDTVSLGLPLLQERVESTSAQVRNLIEQKHDETHTLIAEQSRELSNMLKKGSEINSQLEDVITAQKHRTERIEQRLIAIHEDEKEQKQTIAELITMMQQVKLRVDGIQSSQLLIESNTPESSWTSATHINELSPPKTTKRKPISAYYSPMPVTLKLGMVNNDYTRCVCSCHQIMHWSSPPGLRQFVGRLHIMFRWNLLRRCNCATRSCRGIEGSRKLTITYFFPSTWIDAMLTSGISRDVHGNPTASLTIYNVISKYHAAWQYIEYENIPKLRNLLSKGTVRPTDTDEIGESLLEVRYFSLRNRYPP